MKEEELNKIAEVIHNKIYNENIKVYETVAYAGGKYNNKVLPANKIAISDIKKAITSEEDLNQINGLDMKKYVNIDLNHFLEKVYIIREQNVKSYVENIEKADNCLRIYWYLTLLDSFTYEEGLEIKKAFLTKILNFSIMDKVKSDLIDWLFFSILGEIIQKEQEMTRELVK